MATQINDNNFEQFVNAQSGLVVLDCGATWCGPCQHIAPIIDELAKEYEGKALIAKCDVDDSPEIPSKFGIRNVPTVLFIKNGELKDKLVGAQSKSSYKEKIEQYL
ncbi:MAG: thioredoxin [Bacteroidales bacterium]|nr:thioredoxin [Bacteroidales bacterium]MBQ7984740.1 thioredoxin [Bacteroidales bacterium]